MTLPDIGPNPLPPSAWARKVRRSEPHGLDVLEAHVVAFRTRAAKWASSSVLSRAWTVILIFVPMLASIGGFAALLGDDRAIRLGRMEAPTFDDIPLAMISYAVAVLGLIGYFVYWLREGRTRVGGLIPVVVIIFVFGAIGIPVAYMLAARDDGDIGLLLLPVYVMMALAAVLFVLLLKSPRPEPEVEEDVALEDLDERSVKLLLQHRGWAIDELVKRRMLPDENIDALKARPLGRLHIEEDA